MWQTRKERLNRSKNNGDMADKAKRPIVSKGVGESLSDTNLIIEKLIL